MKETDRQFKKKLAYQSPLLNYKSYLKYEYNTEIVPVVKIKTNLFLFSKTF